MNECHIPIMLTIFCLMVSPFRPLPVKRKEGGASCTERDPSFCVNWSENWSESMWFSFQSQARSHCFGLKCVVDFVVVEMLVTFDVCMYQSELAHT